MRRVLLRVPSRDRRPHPCGLQNSGSRHQGGNVGRQSAAGRPRSSLACADDVAIIARAGDLEAQCLALLVQGNAPFRTIPSCYETLYFTQMA